jgi:Fur family zinc uptake transcriptional regulator
MDIALEVRAGSQEGEPEARASGSLPPIEDYYRLGKDRRVSWTGTRSEILLLLWKTRKPLGAYGIAERLSRTDQKTHPNSVYRSIKSLEAARLVIPIISWSRYLISPDPSSGSWGIILCSRCRNFAVVAMDDEEQWLWSVARGMGFQPRSATIECIATCASCSHGGSPST